MPCKIGDFSALLLLGSLSLCSPTAFPATQERPDADMRATLIEAVNSSDSFADRFDAEVWLVDMSNRLTRFVDEPAVRLELLRQIHAAASRAALPPELVLSVIEVESHFNRFAISSVGAQGMMQVMPFWKDEIGRQDDNLTVNKTNFEYGCRILQFYLQRENGHLHKALARYNGSVGSRRYSDKVYRAWRDHWRTEPLNWID